MKANMFSSWFPLALDSTLGAEHLNTQHNRTYSRLLILMRFIFCMAACLITCLGIWGMHLLPQVVFYPILGISAFLFVINLVFLYYHAQGRSLLLLQFITDIAGFVMIMHFAGGVENPFLPLLTIHVILGGLFLSAKQSILVTGFAFLLLCVMLIAEAHSWIEHYTIVLFPHGDHGNEHAAHHGEFVYSTIAFYLILWGIVTAFMIGVSKWIKTVEKYLLQEKLEADRKESEIRVLASKLLTARDEERANIAKFCHDEVGGGLFGLEMKIHSLIASHTQNKESLFEKQARSITKNLKDLVGEVRTLSHELSPVTTLDDNPSGAMRDLLESFAKSHSEINLNFEIADIPNSAEPGLRKNLLLILQEALMNIHKYALAKNVRVRVRLQNQVLSLVIQDDGEGISNIKLLENGIGLRLMRERVRQDHGQFRLFLLRKGVTIGVRYKIK